jgi:hypothetical protein
MMNIERIEAKMISNRKVAVAAICLLTASVFAVGQAPAPEVPAAGTAWRGIVGENFVNKTGVNVDVEFQSGLSTNNTSDGGVDASGGGANSPVGAPGDTGFSLQDLWAYIHRDPRANVIADVTPLPGPMPKHFDWGFEAEVDYGRDCQPCRMYGIDEYWGVNEPGASSPALAATNRQNFLAAPELYLHAYLPVYKGIVIKGGRWGQGLGYEIPPLVLHGPDFFYSHNYSFYADTAQVLGIEAAINLYRNPKHGYLSADIGLNNGKQTAISPSGHPMQNPAISLRWRSPHMNTWIDYNSRYEMANIKTNALGVPVNNYNFQTGFTVLSPRAQWRQFQNLVITHEFNRHWNAEIEGVWFKQSGDGKADTVWCMYGAIGGCDLPNATTVSGTTSVANYRGSAAAGVNGRIVYEFNHKFALGTRLETFHDADGYFLSGLDFYHVIPADGPPNFSMSKGYFNDWTVGANYTVNKFIKIRPEVRYDWNNSGAYGAGNASVVSGASQPQKNQVILAMDMVIWF